MKRIVKLRERELGNIAYKTFSDSVLSSEEIVRSLGIKNTLKGHRGCVNTLCFNTDGTVLLSGSDDRRIILWNWEVGSEQFSFYTGHTDNILHAEFVPYRDDKTIITCSADGQVRRVDLSKGVVDIKVLSKQHQRNRIHKMAVEPGSPNTFYSCSEDGSVIQYDLRTNHAKKLFQCLSDTSSEIIELYSIAIDPTNPNIFSVAGSDQYARLYDVRKCNSNNSLCRIASFCPPNLVDGYSDGITGLAYSYSGELLVSFFMDSIYLFPKDYASCDNANNNDTNDDMSRVKAYKGHLNKDTIKGVYFLGPRCEYICSGSDTGHAFIWRKKDGQILRVLKGDKSVLNCVESHPLDSTIVTSGIQKDIKVWSPCFDENTPNRDEVNNMTDFIVDLYAGSSSSDDGVFNYYDYDDDEIEEEADDDDDEIEEDDDEIEEDDDDEDGDDGDGGSDDDEINDGIDNDG